MHVWNVPFKKKKIGHSCWYLSAVTFLSPLRFNTFCMWCSTNSPYTCTLGRVHYQLGQTLFHQRAPLAQTHSLWEQTQIKSKSWFIDFWVYKVNLNKQQKNTFYLTFRYWPWQVGQHSPFCLAGWLHFSVGHDESIRSQDTSPAWKVRLKM